MNDRTFERTCRRCGATFPGTSPHSKVCGPCLAIKNHRREYFRAYFVAHRDEHNAKRLVRYHALTLDKKRERNRNSYIQQRERNGKRRNYSLVAKVGKAWGVPAAVARRYIAEGFPP